MEHWVYMGQPTKFCRRKLTIAAESFFHWVTVYFPTITDLHWEL